MSKKKIILIIVIIVFIILSFSLIVFIKNNTEKEVDQSIVNEEKESIDLETSKADDNKEVINESKEESPETKSVETTTQDSNNISSNNNNSNNNQTSTSTNQEPKKEETTQVQPSKTCTPKKFVFSWARADFDNEQACINKGNSYMPTYGFSCDSYPDDCGITYYTLTLFDTNGAEYDFHNIN